MKCPHQKLSSVAATDNDYQRLSTIIVELEGNRLYYCAENTP